MSMYENFDEMQALTEQAKKRLGEGIESSEVGPEDDLYAEFRQYGEDNVESANEYTEQQGTVQEVKTEEFYKELPYLDNSGEYEESPHLDPYDEPLFPGGPYKSQIEAWKKEWEGYSIYVTEILTEKFVFRTLNRFEYKQLISLQNVDALQREEVICQTVTLWPGGYEWKTMATDKAGLPSTLSDIIMEKSGFTKDYAIQVL